MTTLNFCSSHRKTVANLCEYSIELLKLETLLSLKLPKEKQLLIKTSEGRSHTEIFCRFALKQTLLCFLTVQNSNIIASHQIQISSCAFLITASHTAHFTGVGQAHLSTWDKPGKAC